jgi:hypothetical protein
MATYYWDVPGDIDPIPTYQFRLTANDTATPFYSKEFRLVGGRIRDLLGSGRGSRRVVGGAIGAVLVLLCVLAGVCFWRWRKRDMRWWRTATVGSEELDHEG